METSVMLHLKPETVKMELAADGAFRKSRFEAINKGWVTIARDWKKLTVSSGVGYPMKADAEKGKKFLDITVERISKFLLELSNAEMKGNFPFEN
jgi:creatinine amidohydrolase